MRFFCLHYYQSEKGVEWCGLLTFSETLDAEPGYFGEDRLCAMVGLLEADRAATACGRAGDGGRSDGLVAMMVVDDVSVAARELVVSSCTGDDLLFRQWWSMVCHRPTTTTTTSTAPKRQQMVVDVDDLPFICKQM